MKPKHFESLSLIVELIGITLTQFYINFSRQGHQIELILVAINLGLGFSLYPLSFYRNSPFKVNISQRRKEQIDKNPKTVFIFLKPVFTCLMHN